jgi:hypothetical protein
MTKNGLYRFDESTRIVATLTSSDSWWKQAIERLTGGKFWVEGAIRPLVRYSDTNNQDPYDSSLARHFRIILERDKVRFEEKVNRLDYSSADGFERTVAAGPCTLYLSLIDEWNNRFDYTIASWVLPGSLTAAIAVGAAWTVTVVVIVVLAPFSSFCHWLLMNPFARNVGSLGMAPIALTVFPFVRRHVLRRYLRGLRDDESVAHRHGGYVVPSADFDTQAFGRRLAQLRSVLVFGQSGVGKTAFLSRLAASYAAKRAGRLPLRGVTPVLLALRLHEGTDPIAIFADELARVGQVSDRALAEWFLVQGTFLIMIDGLNEVGEADQRRVVSFVKRHEKGNYFIVTAQDSHPEFMERQRVEMVGLTPQTVNEVIRQKRPSQADVIIGQFSAGLYRACRIPQDLEFALEHWDRTRALPKHRSELYRSTIEAVLGPEAEPGQADYLHSLHIQALEMLLSRTAAIEPKGIPDSVHKRLQEAKLIVRQGEQYYFRHDLVRAYLASIAFASEWRSIVGHDTRVDSNWLPMLQFVCLEVDAPCDVKDLLLAILTKNASIAGDVFRWVRDVRPDLCESWYEEFYREFAKDFFGRPQSSDAPDH